MIIPLARRCRTLASAVGALLLSGCHTWIPVERPEHGSAVRVHLSSDELTGESRHVSGRLLQTGDTLLVVGNMDRRLSTYPELMRPDSVRVAADLVERIEAREISVARSTGLAVLLLAGGIALTAALGAVVEEGGDGDGEIPPPVNAKLTPLLTLLKGFVGR